MGREEEGLSWLETRVRTFAASPRAPWPWISWIGALEDFGHPERALDACHKALRNRSSPELLAFASPFFARMGHWEESETALRQLEAAGHSSFYCRASLEFHRMRGELDAAIGFCEEWSRRHPRDVQPRRQLLELIARRDGARAAFHLAGKWSAEQPGHDQLEELLYAQMDGINVDWRRDLLLARRVRRNPEDGWAWRQLTYSHLDGYARAGTEKRERLRPRIEKLLAHCDRTAPAAPATLGAHAFWSELRGDRAGAVAAGLKTIDEDPGSFFGYKRIWECSAGLQEAERRNVFRQIEAQLLGSHGRLSAARDIIFLVAERFGVAFAEEAVTRWRSHRPNDPEVIYAAVVLLLRYGHGRSDTERAIALLEPAVDHYPYHLGLRFSLAHARRSLGRVDEAEESLREIIRRHPDHYGAYVDLAKICEQKGDLDEGRRLLESAAERDPLNPAVWRSRAGLLIREGSVSDARALIQLGLQRMPESVHLRIEANSMICGLRCGNRRSWRRRSSRPRWCARVS